MELLKKNALEIVTLLKSKEISPLDCLDSIEKRISVIDAKVNALPTLCFDRARNHAKKLENLPINKRGVLAGLPVPIKDLINVSGVRSTNGSTIFKNNIPKYSDFLVKHIENNGGIVYAKSNTPEFGAGANTFNEVFGFTRNPWNTNLSAAGSSGGAAVSIATGMAWVAHGSDMGGSLRNPASFCGVVGMRPSIGRVSSSIYNKVDGTLGVEGPMARNIKDLAMFFDAMVGENKDDPLSIKTEGLSFLEQAKSDWKPKKIAFSYDLGLPPVDKRIKKVIKDVVNLLDKEGVIVEEKHPDLKDAPECFQTLRALYFYIGLKDLYIFHKEKLKPEIIWNIEKGMNLTIEKIALAENQRLRIFNNMNNFFKNYDLIICPTTIVPPFPIEQRYLKECEGQKFETYIDWLNIVSAITLSLCPALSLPAGFTDDKLPLSIQIIAPNKKEGRLLSGSAFIEKVISLKNYLPISPICK